MKVWDCVQKTLLLYQSKSTIYHMKRLLLSLLLVLMLSFMKAFALQTPLTFYRLGIRDGLSNSQINSVFKDSKGYIWFGTASGLDRFDGFRFSNFFHKAEDKTSLLNDVVNEIQEDAASDLWVSTGSGYCRFIRKQGVFERFYQALHEGKIAASGSGIGLSIVKKFVEMHGGKVSVTDNPGGGTVFICLIPMRREEGVPMLIPSNAENEEVDVQHQLQHDVQEDVFDDEVKTMALRAEGTRKVDLLIVDDSEDYLVFMAEVLSQYYHVRVAHHGKEALESIKVQRPDVILSDVMMPEMDGNTLCKILKGDRNTCDIPFIMLTARVADAHKLEGLALGADDYITMPFSIELLILRINNLIKWYNGTKNKLVNPKIRQVEITSLDEKMVKDATEYIENNLSNADISVESLSASLAMSRVQLYKRLLSTTGLTPSEFIRNIRLRHAEQLLRQSQRSVSEIAYQVGFNNPRYFSRYFSEMYGVTPSVYKQRYGK